MSIGSTPFSEGTTSGFLHRPPSTPVGGLVLTHGAGRDCNSPLLVSVAAGIAEVGYLVLRCDLRFRQKRRAGPPHPSSAVDDRAGLREALNHLQPLSPGPLYLGGHSYGGRQSSLLMVEPEPPPVAALLLLSYPLHPPRKPDQWRSDHFPRLTTPSLFIHGTRDSFGSPDEMRQALGLYPSSTKTGLILVDGAGHELSARNAKTADHCATAFCSFLQTLA